MQTPETNEASQTQTSLSEFHSVHLQEDLCKGCTICVTGCPVEAIRVRNGKAHIIEAKCIDCGDCIRHCPSHAKYSFSSHIDELDAYTKTAALLSPAIYGQFNIHYSKAQIHVAFRALGFSDVFDVSEDALRITKATAKFILEHKHINEPFISCSCPTIIKLIQVRFPSLIDNILAFIPPIELCARRAKRELEASANANDTPCAAKITIARTPVGYGKTALTGAFAFDKLYLPLVTALRKMRDEEKKQGTALSFYDDAPQGISWGRQFGEAEYLVDYIKQMESQNTSEAGSCETQGSTKPKMRKQFNWISSAGISQSMQTLETIDDEQMWRYDFAELWVCSGTCVNGSLMVRSASEGQAVLRSRLHTTAKQKVFLLENDKDKNEDELLRDEEIIGRQAQKLSDDFATAKKMMQAIDDIASSLPALDCGSCGSPNCRALAEDIVRGNAKKEDCVFILKMKYEELLFGKRKDT